MNPAEDELERVERAALVEEILSVVRHDVRNGLHSIRLASFYISRKVRATPLWTEDEKVPRFFEQIVEEIARANDALTHRATALAAPEQEAERVARTDCIADVTDALGARLIDGGEPSLVAANPNELRVAIRCLLRNAIERPVKNLPPEVRVSRHDSFVRFDVVDDGPSLSDTELRAARTAFRTTKPGHLGVGLNIVDRFAARHGGSFELLADAPGTVARLVLPSADELR